LSSQNCTVPAPFLHRFSISLFITHRPSTTYKTIPPKVVQFQGDIASPTVLSTVPLVEAEGLAKAEARRRPIHAPRSNVSRASVTAKFDIFFTFSPSHFENTHHRPLPLNHLRKMPEKTVQFRVDIGQASGIGVAPMCSCLSIEAMRRDQLGRFSPRFPNIPGRLASCQPTANRLPTCANLCQPKDGINE
jgi:hypothetical protein